MMKNIITVILGLLLLQPTWGQNNMSSYYQAFDEMLAMLTGKKPLDFKRAVFLTENAYLDNQISYEDFCKILVENASICYMLKNSFDLTYPDNDKGRTKTYAAVFKFMTDTIPIMVNDSTAFLHPPFAYNFEDFAGDKDWSNMFVTKLLATHRGNCHSLPILYKLLTEILGEPAWLSVAPNHFYIKLRNKQSGWFNTELTSGYFPTDAWLISSGYIHLDAVRNGVYMDTLSLKESVAMCLTDLAEGFQRKFGNDNRGFILNCCETTLKYYPDYINALLLQAETMMSAYRGLSDKNSPESQQLFAKTEAMYVHIHKIGYRKMPKEMYLDWLMSLNEQNELYQNRKIQPLKIKNN